MEKVYKKGIRLYNQKRFLEAENCFKKCLGTSYEKKAIFYLLLIYKSCSWFDKIEDFFTCFSILDYEMYLYLANMKMREYNFSACEALLKKAGEDKKTDDYYFLLAKLYMQKGEFIKSEKILEKKKNFVNEEKRQEKLLLFYFWQKDYEKCAFFYEKWQKDTFFYSRLEGYLKLQQVFKNNELSRKQRGDYILMIERATKKYRQKALEHIKWRHFNEKDSSYFLQNISLDRLYNQIEKKISNLNYVTKEFASCYRFSLPKSIGKSAGHITSDMQVVTTPSKKIITMFPISLSSTFNQEGFLYDETLLRKRSKTKVDNNSFV